MYGEWERVCRQEIINLAFDGPGTPTHHRSPVTQGQSGAAVVSKRCAAPPSPRFSRNRERESTSLIGFLVLSPTQRRLGDALQGECVREVR